MPIGKNLKRQQLIADEPKSTKGKKTSASTSKAKKKPSSAKKQKVSSARQTVAQATTLRNQPIETHTAQYISEARYIKRKQLKEKFDNQLKELRGQKIQLIVFKLGQEEYAFDLTKAQEVIPTPPISKMPHTPDHIAGVLEVRGVVVVVLNLASKFNLKNENQAHSQYILIMQDDKLKVGVLLEKVPVTLTIQGDDIKSASNIVAETTLDETYIKGVIKINDKMIFYVDIEELIESEKVNIIPEKHTETKPNKPIAIVE